MITTVRSKNLHSATVQRRIFRISPSAPNSIIDYTDHRTGQSPCLKGLLLRHSNR